MRPGRRNAIAAGAAEAAGGAALALGFATPLAAVIALAETGPGEPSLEAARGRERSGAAWALAALALGALGSLGANLASNAQSSSP